MYPDAVTEIAKAGASGIPVLYEWGGLVTLLTLMVMVLIAGIIAEALIIWQMYKQNQDMFAKSLEASNRSSEAIELIARVAGGQKQ
jgi:hypothetical protein